MNIRIITFQTDPKCVYNISHKFSMFLEMKLDEYFSNIHTELNLDLSIICLSRNVDDLELGRNMKHRGKGRNVTQQIILPNRHLYFEQENVFNLKKFDFVFKEKGYQTYPLDLFVRYTIDGILAYLSQNNLEVPKEGDIKAFADKLANESISKLIKFKYESEELIILRELIDKTHWAFKDNDGKEWFESEIGQNWLKLSEKYSFDELGMLIRNN